MTQDLVVALLWSGGAAVLVALEVWQHRLRREQRRLAAALAAAEHTRREVLDRRVAELERGLSSLDRAIAEVAGRTGSTLASSAAIAGHVGQLAAGMQQLGERIENLEARWQARLN